MGAIGASKKTCSSSGPFRHRGKVGLDVREGIDTEAGNIWSPECDVNCSVTVVAPLG